MPTPTTSNGDSLLFPEAAKPAASPANLLDTYTPPSSFAFNNSSLSWLACSQRYVYRVVHGAVMSKKKELPLTIGSIFHKFIELLDKNELITLLLNPDSWPEWIRDFDRKKALSLLALANQVRLENADLFPFNDHLQEFFGEVALQQRNGLFAVYSFTIDLLTYHEVSDSVTITDFKTTKLPLDGNLVTTYDLKFQRLFYEKCLRLLADMAGNNLLPVQYRAAIAAGRTQFRYIFVNHETGKYIAMPAKPYNQRIHDEYAPLLVEKVAWASFLHEKPWIARKDGVLHDLCGRCEFRHVCALHDPSAEAKQIAAWPYGFKKYTAKHDDND